MERGLIDVYCLLKRQPAVALPMARQWMRHLLTAVDHLHGLRVVHQADSSKTIILYFLKNIILYFKIVIKWGTTSTACA